MIRKIKITSILIMLVISIAQGQNTNLSLKQAVKLGLEKNVEVKNTILEQKKSQIQLEEQQSKLYPNVEAFSTYSYYFAIPKMILPGEMFGQTGDIPVEVMTTNDWSSGFKATQLLYSQSYFTSLKLFREQTHLAKLDIKQKQEEVAYQVSQVYYLCQTTQQQIGHLEVTLKNMERLLEITELLHNNEIIRKVDHNQVLVDQNNLLTEVDNLVRLHNQQIRLLKYFTGISLDTNIELTDSFDSPALINKDSTILTPGLITRIEIQAIDKQIEIAVLSRKINKQSYLPTLSGFAQYSYQGQRNKFDFFKGGETKFYKMGVLGLNLSIPIFDGFEKRAKIKQDDISLMQLQNIRENTLEYFNKEFSDAQKQYEVSKEALTRQKKNILIAEENYNITFLGYKKQTVSLTNLLQVQGSLTEAHLSYNNALLQLKIAELDLKKSKGELLSRQ